jgi:hypothetical protein
MGRRAWAWMMYGRWAEVVEGMGQATYGRVGGRRAEMIDDESRTGVGTP